MSELDLDRPYRLKDILLLAYPGGEMTVSGLRKEIWRGNLEAEYVAGKLFVTLRAINVMREKCRVLGKARASGSGRKGSTRKPANASQPAPGSSLTAPSMSPQDALRERLRLRNERSQNTTSSNTGRRAANAT